jgi:peptidoglycan/xylan/chitin deacetylase (PgdA/CDA1 family)
VRPPLILAYHVIGEVAPAHDPHNLAVAPSVFAGQVRALRSRGYTFVTMAELAARLPRASGLCALTFDDGARDEVPALLAALGVPGTLYVCPELLGVPHPFLAAEARVRLMTGEELAALPDGIELGSHTLRHTVLDDASRAAALREMLDSKAALEALRGTPVSTFAYPECGYSAACPDAAREAGYATAVTCGARGSLDPWQLRRVSIDALENRLTWALKSRDLWRHVFGSAPGRLARRAARPFRHGTLR